MVSTQDRSAFATPPALLPGDTVRVVAPASRFDRALVWRGLGWLKERYRVKFDPSLFSRDGGFAGSDERRLTELNRAIADPEVRAVVAARGGYGVTRIAHRVDWTGLERSPKWLVGFSDITALHLETTRMKVASLHAHNVGGLGRGDARERNQWVAALENPTLCRSVANLEVWHPGRASGTLAGGNLTLIFTAAAAGRLHLPDGSVLILEDVAEPAYRIDRMLTALLVSGHLARVAGVVVGEFVDCPTGQFGLPALAVVRERLAELRVPVLGGVAFGHGRRNLPLPLGLMAAVDGTSGALTICPNETPPSVV
jgi:muramoyltetrapeptide carboxypeptidase